MQTKNKLNEAWNDLNLNIYINFKYAKRKILTNLFQFAKFMWNLQYSHLPILLFARNFIAKLYYRLHSNLKTLQWIQQLVCQDSIIFEVNQPTLNHFGQEIREKVKDNLIRVLANRLDHMNDVVAKLSMRLSWLAFCVR